MKPSIKIEKSCGAIVCQERDGLPHVLVIRHRNGGHWGFPKGHVEDNETEVETARREIREETGLKAQVDTGFRRVITYSPKPHVMKDVVFFAAAPDGGTLKWQEAEVEEGRWATLGQALDLLTYETDKEVLRAFIAYYQKHW